jgi:hypothetical protein
MKKTIWPFLLTLSLIGPILSASCISSKALVITSNSLPEGIEGVTYSQILQVHGGTPPYIWSVTGGEIPIGLQLNPISGVVSGTPIIAQSGAFVTFQVTDDAKKIAFKQILMAINPATTTKSTTTTTSGNGNSVSSNSTNGLSLSLSLEGATYQPNQEISITVDEANTLPEINNVPVSNNRAYSGLQAAPCDYISPYGIVRWSPKTGHIYKLIAPIYLLG